MLKSRPAKTPISMVMLLRWPCRWSRHELVRAAERAWASAGFAADDAAIEQSENKAVVIFLPHIVSMLSSDEPYLGKDPRTHAKTFPDPAQRDAWAQHTAWIALDYHGDAPDAETAYGLLGGFAAELLDANCTGIFIPGQGQLMPNDNSLLASLRTIAASER